MPKNAHGSLTNQYFTITREGHTRITPSIGGGTCISHFAFWPTRELDPQNLDMRPVNDEGQLDTAKKPVSHDHALEIYEDRRERLVAAFNHVLAKLQREGRNPAAGQAEQFELIEPDDWDIDQSARVWKTVDGSYKTEPHQKPRKIFFAETIGFTLWLPDGDRTAVMTRAGSGNWSPAPDDIRVRVQAEAHPDFFTLSLFIDPTMMWSRFNDPRTLQPVHDSATALGNRRKRMFQAVETIRRVCDARLASPVVELALLPELAAHISPIDAAALKQAADFLYGDIWREFATSFDFELSDLADPRGPDGRRVVMAKALPEGLKPETYDKSAFRTFAFFRGLVLPSLADTGGPAQRNPNKRMQVVEPDVTKPGGGAEVGHGSQPRFFGEGLRGEQYADHFTEANAAVKAYWPFIRRVTPEADFRDYVASGIFDFRALYISSLGAQSEFDKFDDGEVDQKDGNTVRIADLPSGELPWSQPGRRPADAGHTTGQYIGEDGRLYAGNDRPASPIRYLILTKGEPHRRQLGRMVERVNAIGTFRLFALKNLTILREASTHIRIFGQELDAITSHRNQRIEELYKKNYGQFATLTERMNWAQDQLAGLKKAHPPGQSGVGFRKATPKTLVPLRSHDPTLVLKGLSPTKKFETLMSVEEVEEFVRDLERERAKFDAELATINTDADRRLLSLSSNLDDTGADAIGGLPYRLNRARYYIGNVRHLVASLEARNIDPWVSYNQFVERGLEPSFRFIEDVGQRLLSLRVRLQAAMQGIQTSAIVNQTEATRYNTYALEQIVDKVSELVAAAEPLRRKALWWERTKNIAIVINTLFSLAILAYSVDMQKVRPFLNWLRSLLPF